MITLGSLSIAQATKMITLEPVDKYILDTSLINCEHVTRHSRKKANCRKDKYLNLRFCLSFSPQNFCTGILA